MKTPRARHHRTQGASSPTPGGMRKSPPRGPLTTLQAKATDSAAVRQLREMQARAGLPLQRVDDPSTAAIDDTGTLSWDKSKGVPGWAKYQYNQDHAQVDQSSSPFLPNYGPEHDDPGWKHSQGVPDWAKQEYKTQSKVKLIASVKDGLIGSIYFLDGRIRTTHGDGPTLELDNPRERTSRFNLDRGKAFDLFWKTNRGIYEFFYAQTDNSLTPQQREEQAAILVGKQFDQWLAVYLNLTPVDQLPDWVTPVTRADEAFDTDAADPSDDITLFEVFTKVSNGKVQSWHPSRGIAAKFETNKQVVSVLKAALRHIDGVTDVNQRNTLFYDFIKSRLPVFANQIRRPDQI
ncbi:hypothetical protein [Roseobacter sinensis]|uniref:Uncharacterized protein n=1 Tax=Roseobacter sinensis TaxID=2931391 RepID=A0ABT3BKH1_9RHOB|nr:hypothetical protein [Roseobacter sp. WL0113]MCV3273728.1 hypothetical protein [Roseobacter sp. WL0113]